MQRRWIRLALVTCCLPAHAAAQAQPRSYQAPYLVSAPSIDWRLDEAAWKGPCPNKRVAPALNEQHV